MAYDQNSQYQPPARDYLGSRGQQAPAYGGGYGDAGYGDQQGYSQSRKPVPQGNGMSRNGFRAGYANEWHNNQTDYGYGGTNGHQPVQGREPPADDYGYGGQYGDSGRPAGKSPSLRSNGSGRSPGGPSPGGYSQAYPRKQSYETSRPNGVDRDLNRAMGDMSVSGNGYGQSVTQQRRPGTSNSNRSNHSLKNNGGNYGGGYGHEQNGYGGYAPQQGLRADRYREAHTAPSSPARDYHPSYERSMTMPTETGSSYGRNVPHRQASDRGPSGPYDSSNRSRSDRQANQYGDLYNQQPYTEAPRGENHEVLDSYYGNTNQPFINGQPQQYSPEEEMPNFDLPAQKPAHKRGMSIDKHLEDVPRSATDNRGRGYEAVRGDFGAQAYRSRSQPNLRDQNPRGPSRNEAPPIPGFDRGQPVGRGPDPYGDPNGYGPPHGPPRGGYGPGRGRGGPMPRGGPNMRGLGPGPGPSGRLPGPPASMRGTPRPGRGGPPGRPDPRGPNGPQRSPSNGQPSPDALPQHPAPVRPGLMQGSTNQTPPRTDSRPPPNEPQEPADRRASSVPVTYKELETLRQNAANHPNDRRLQLQLVKKLVEAGSVLADDGGRADARTQKVNREKFYYDAHKMVKKLVSAGSAEAMFYLADCYSQGDMGLEPDNREAFKLYQSAAKSGHPQAAYRTAVCCELGQEDGGGTTKDPLKAVEWYKRSAAMSDPQAMFKMGMIQLKGLLGQPKNPREAIVWLKRAADRADEDNPHALHELGLLYQNASPNDSIVKDEGYARQLFFKAAELGYKFSQFRLGAAHEFGTMGCPIDPRTSIAWYSRAAVQEEHQSELALSGWYLTGVEGILQQNDTEAYLWARKSAQAGLAKAEYAMGYFTEVGIGCPPNMEEAKRWYQRAAGQNFAKARERLDEIRRGGPKAQKTRERLSRSKQKEGDCVVM